MVTRDQQVRESNAQETAETLIRLADDDLHFIVSYDPDRERSASRRDLVAVIEEIQALVNDGVIALEAS